ncbi:WAT1-related protein At1g68170-like [Coffea eugenioides]|uniref:WAT1-related protein At1g68170-like n=1 Tax=Coffea eugenioides TaxID=49369 RepID=UPI000F612B6F|nr:WAT1-related protein At1g68170-like [Coffea eugenioides]
MARNVCFISEELKPAVVMVIVQVASTGSNFMYKIAMANGMGIQTIILYKLLFATVFMAPIAFFTERATLGNYLYVKSMSLTSATFVTAMFNLIPGFTLVLALIFRLEKLDVRNSAGKAKVLGTVLGSGGAMILTFVKGKKIKILSQHVDIIPLHNHASVPSNNVVGSLLALLSCLSFAIWLVIQTKMSHSYPCYSSIAVMCFTGSILTGVLAICTERELSSWMLGWDCRLLAVAYLGIVSSGLCVAAVFWSSMMKGPLFVSSFSPLGLVFTALAGSLFLKEELCLGSLIGSIIITIGLCLLIWGKGKEATASQDGETESRRDEVTDGSQAAPPISNKWGSSTI